MITGHASHQVGLDADIFSSRCRRANSLRAEREETSRRPWWGRPALTSISKV
jgi:murein endopeptidase